MDMVAAEMGMRGRTRERDAAVEDETAKVTVAVKRRKVEDYSPCSVQLRRNTGSGTVAETSVVIGRYSSAGDRCESPNSEGSLGGDSISCCSSSVFVQKLKGKIQLVDLEEDDAAVTQTSKHCSRNSPSEVQEESECMDSAGEIQPSDEAKCRQNSTVTEEELEDFFMAAEKDLRNQIHECSNKYNFDFVKEEAFDGRFEWIQLMP